MRFNALFGLVVTVYGLSYARLALLIYGGKNLADSDGNISQSFDKGPHKFGRHF